MVTKKVGNVERLKEVYLCLLKRLRLNIYTEDVQGILEAVYQVSELSTNLKIYKYRNSTELVTKKVGNVERLREVYLCLLKRLRVNIYTGDVQWIHEAVYQVSEL